MNLNRVGFVGWRGMVGSVLLQRMRAENDFSMIQEAVFFTTSQRGKPGPDVGQGATVLQDAFDLNALKNLDIIVTCQGGDYTDEVYSKLRNQGWKGYWIDAASSLRLAKDSIIILDPVNLAVIERGLALGNKDFIGGNCTVSLMMMALDGLFNADLIEWMTATTYQAISGAGAVQMRELLAQMGAIHADVAGLLGSADSSILAIDAQVKATMNSANFPTNAIGSALAGSLLPWIDADLDSGSSREEWKGAVEAHKIMGEKGTPIPLESTCIRIGTMRCHSQAFTIKLKGDLPLDEIGERIDRANDWVSLVPNDAQASLHRLTPARVTGSLEIAVGRLRKSAMGAQYLSLFTVGDQLLWGAAEPLRRMLRILHQH